MKAAPLRPAPYRVRRIKRELHGVTTLELVPAQGAVPAFEPGQFNMLYAFGVGEAAISISGDPAQADCLTHTVREMGAISTALAQAHPGTMLGVRGPFGTAWPTRAAEGLDVVLIAGGLGLAPLRPAILRLLAARPLYGRLILLYGARSPNELLYRHELEHWRQRLDVDIHVTVDYADAGWHGNVGVVPRLIPRLGLDAQNTLAMVCGPEVMMRFCGAALHDAGVAMDRIHLSMERNMKCALGLCGHCQFGADFICKTGAVMRYDQVAQRLRLREI